MSRNETKKLGPFEIVKDLAAKGAQGKLFVGRVIEESFSGLELGQLVALKVMPVHSDDEERQFRRLNRRTNALVATNHPGVVRYYGCFASTGGFSEDIHVVVMELLKGCTLEEKLQNNPLGIDADEALRIIRTCSDALACAAEHGIVHRDIKPSNIFICDDGSAKLIDFEIASQDGASRTTTESGALRGTVDYMAPDFHQDFRPERGFRGDQCSDVFSLTVCLYEMLAGCRPYASGGALGEQSMMAYFQRWTRVEGVDPTRSLKIETYKIHSLAHIQKVIKTGLSPERKNRYKTYREFYNALTPVKTREIISPHSRYQLLHCVGKGGFGVVFRARRVSDNLIVAIKCLLKADYSERFIREAKVLEKFNDDRLVGFVEYFKTVRGATETFFIVMRFLEGMPGASLRDRISDTKGKTGLPPKEILEAFIRYAEGLQLLHSEGIIHRDIKPANLYMPKGSPDRACVMDLGVVKTDETQTNGSLPGTLDYMPPEMAFGQSRGIPAVDIYALGLCLHEALTGKPVYPRLKRGADGLAEFYKRSKAKELPDLTQLSDTPRLRELVEKMIHPDLTHRFNSAKDVINALKVIPKTEVPDFDDSKKSIFESETTDDFPNPKHLDREVGIDPSQNDIDSDSTEVAVETPENSAQVEKTITSAQGTISKPENEHSFDVKVAQHKNKSASKGEDEDGGETVIVGSQQQEQFRQQRNDAETFATMATVATQATSATIATKAANSISNLSSTQSSMQNRGVIQTHPAKSYASLVIIIAAVFVAMAVSLVYLQSKADDMGYSFSEYMKKEILKIHDDKPRAIEEATAAFNEKLLGAEDKLNRLQSGIASSENLDDIKSNLNAIKAEVEEAEHLAKDAGVPTDTSMSEIEASIKNIATNISYQIKYLEIKGRAVESADDYENQLLNLDDLSNEKSLPDDIKTNCKNLLKELKSMKTSVTLTNNSDHRLKVTVGEETHEINAHEEYMFNNLPVWNKVDVSYTLADKNLNEDYLCKIVTVETTGAKFTSQAKLSPMYKGNPKVVFVNNNEVNATVRLNSNKEYTVKANGVIEITDLRPRTTYKISYGTSNFSYKIPSGNSIERAFSAGTASEILVPNMVKKGKPKLIFENKSNKVQWSIILNSERGSSKNAEVFDRKKEVEIDPDARVTVVCVPTIIVNIGSDKITNKWCDRIKDFKCEYFAVTNTYILSYEESKNIELGVSNLVVNTSNRIDNLNASRGQDFDKWFWVSDDDFIDNSERVKDKEKQLLIRVLKESSISMNDWSKPGQWIGCLKRARYLVENAVRYQLTADKKIKDDLLGLLQKYSDEWKNSDIEKTGEHYNECESCVEKIDKFLKTCE